MENVKGGDFGHGHTDKRLMLVGAWWGVKQVWGMQASLETPNGGSCLCETKSWEGRLGLFLFSKGTVASGADVTLQRQELIFSLN